MSICDRCIHDEVCGLEGNHEEAIAFCSEIMPKTGHWIPVSERLPEDSHAVLVWCPERKNIYCAYREENQWWIFGAYFEKVRLDVTAWMPLPEPYKEGEDKE